MRIMSEGMDMVEGLSVRFWVKMEAFDSVEIRNYRAASCNVK